MLSPKNIPRRSVGDEGDGDLGLQGLHLESSPSRISANSKNRQIESPTERNQSLQVLMNSFGAYSPANVRSRSVGSSSCSSSRSEIDYSRPTVPPSLPVSPPANGSSSSSPSSELSPPAADDLAGSKTKANKGKNRFSKLRMELASDSTSDGPVGSNSRPPLSPRSPSSTSFKKRTSQKPTEVTRNASGGSASDKSMPVKMQPMALTGGTVSTGILITSPVAASFTGSSNDSSYTAVSVPDRVTSLAKEKGKRKSRGGSIDEPGALLDSASQLNLKDGTKSTSAKTAAAISSPTPSVQAGLQRWILSIGCVNFDLEKGPDLEFLYPSLGISREERDNIAFSSFPDTSIFDDGQAVFSWRVREVPLDSSGSEAPFIATPRKQRTASQSSSLASPGSSGRFSTLPTMHRKGSSPSTSQTHKLWGFEKGRKNPARSLSSDSVEPITSVLAHSTGSSRSVSPFRLQRNDSNLLSTPPLESKGSNTSFETANGSETMPSITSEEVAKGGGSHVPSGRDDATALTNGSTRTSMSSNYIHGYCYFRQKKDASIRRGYFQKSVVILSHLPYVSLLSEIVKKLGPLFFEQGMPALEAFCQDVRNWPAPEPGARLHLAMLGSVISVDLPIQSQFQTSLAAEARIVQNLNAPGKARSGLHIKPDSRNRRGSEEEPILASIPCTPLFDIFRESLDDLWLLWECLLLADPILVVGPDPRICSEAVWHLLDLIRPIPFAGDFRPFFTIHDYDFKTLVTKNKPNAGVILGVTNPFMLQACKHWPHVFKVGNGTGKTSSLASKANNRKSSGGVSAMRPNSTSQGTNKVGGIAGGNSAGGGGPEHMPGLLTKRKRRISKDRPLLRKLHEMAESGSDDEAANAMLRRYFSDLTEMFLAPLNRYVSSLIPAEFDLSSPTQTPRIKPFNSTAFLASLKANGTPLPIRSRNLPTGAAVRQSLYTEFLQCPNFSLWLQDRITLMEEEQYNQKIRALESGSIEQFVSSKTELEAIDLYTRLRTEIATIDDKLATGKKERELSPNSRWKSSHSAMSSTKRDASPAMALSSEPSNKSTARKIQELVRISGNSLTLGEKSLLTKKVHLIEQLDTLIKMLPADTRQSLNLRAAVR